uniref:Uncharacterized protein n=2 Tax=Picea TaxID=3328 RepID=A0A101LZE7_PICGL|nr:hypothetical protein ABT39_MTgene5173 [Picea glauca]QHR91645.1 hypothetical protein Q903MT_gene5680 [Picea sitchensis]
MTTRGSANAYGTVRKSEPPIQLGFSSPWLAKLGMNDGRRQRFRDSQHQTPLNGLSVGITAFIRFLHGKLGISVNCHKFLSLNNTNNWEA